MGFFSKLFKKKDNELNDLLSTVVENKGKLSISVNYKLSCVELKNVFLEDDFNFYSYYKNEESIKNLLNSLLEKIKIENNIEIEKEFYDIKIHFIEKIDKKCIVLEIPYAINECECNFVALTLRLEQYKIYYTNEFYKYNNSFGLCSFSKTGHMSLNPTPQTLDEFIDAL